MLGILINILIVCVIVALIWWVADYLPVPPPLNRLLKIVSVVIGCIVVVLALLQLAGGSLPSLP